MNIKLVLSAAFAVVAYFLGIVADANHNTDNVIYPAACFSKIFLFLAAIPLANSAGKSIRKQLGTTGTSRFKIHKLDPVWRCNSSFCVFLYVAYHCKWKCTAARRADNGGCYDFSYGVDVYDCGCLEFV